MRCPMAFTLLLACAAVAARSAHASGDVAAPSSDGRLPQSPQMAQRVSVELLGRSTLSTLKLLSEKAGVDIGMLAPDLSALGERKLTIIAHDCELRSLLAHIRVALQECHWEATDDTSRPRFRLRWDPEEQNAAWQKRVAERRASTSAPPSSSCGSPDPTAVSQFPSEVALAHILLPRKERLHPLEIQLAIARSTATSVVSDYFAGESIDIPEDMRAGAPLWRVLDVMLDQGIEWAQEGNCLVFHSREWYRLIPEEVPEHLLLPYIDSLATPETIPLRDLVTLALAVSDRPFTRVVGDDNYRAMRRRHSRFHLSALLFLTSLADEQARQVMSEGLPVTALQSAKKEALRQIAQLLGPPLELTDDALFRVEISARGPTPNYNETYMWVQPYLVVGGEMHGTQAHLILPTPDAYPRAHP